MLRKAFHPNVHQIVYRSDRVWGVSPWTNSLISIDPSPNAQDRFEIELLTGKIRKGEPVLATADLDRAHFNSIYWNDERLLIAAHNSGRESFIIEYDPRTYAVRSIRHDAGRMIHSLATEETDLFWISTGTSEIRSASGYRLRLKREEFARGFAMTAELFVVGYSTRAPRSSRIGNDSWIHVIDRISGNVLEEFHLRDTGDLNDLRLLDVTDASHNVRPFWEPSPCANHAVSSGSFGY
jgi:hypothetical protein